ncbi:formyl transferase [Mucor mucedo]|uniref:formyl transferase n=1 Tax=Mucor mucedo TaxID=29922 RepID=UPI00221F52A1|nr:formyl transferase [Mucor mucedo]KAI7890113.1 formyl transferase [Mucor mucedo]
MLKLRHSVINNVFISKSRFHTTSIINKEKLRVLFFGTDDFASTHLKALIKEKQRDESCIESIDLVCPPDRKTGRKLETLTPSETKGVAESNHLPVFFTPPAVNNLEKWNIPTDKTYDLGVVVSFGYFIPPHIISAFKYGAVNVHPSLLPKYRGAAPIQHAILYGDKETGVSVQELDDREFDAGRILAQEKVSLLDKVPVYSELKKSLSDIGSRLLVDTVCHLEDRKKNAQVQDISKATKAPKIQKKWSEIDFETMSAWQAEQLNRAIGEQYPIRTVYHTTSKKPKDIVIQFLNVFLPTQTTIFGPPGTFSWHRPSKSIHIMFGDGSVAGCTHFKVENKGIISASDFINGYQVQGQFGVPMPTDELVFKQNMKKRAKMQRYNSE